MITELKESELATRGLTPLEFRQLPINERRWAAAAIMRTRPDSQSQFAAKMMELGNPNFTQFTVAVGV
jgi:hypothetical protein